ncbi:uncharacterized protein LOC143234326 isoform X2 [Tachypleus tridentatus]|uniref:uncharacterized protein LOC143234326 isoform X2 n=1 Tax=Tachypleus tridentatus TaxID=6853 RepID=UPI003FD306DD
METENIEEELKQTCTGRIRHLLFSKEEWDAYVLEKVRKRENKTKKTKGCNSQGSKDNGDERQSSEDKPKN